MRKTSIAIYLASAATLGGQPQDFDQNQQTLDGGVVMLSSSGDNELSGTVGEPVANAVVITRDDLEPNGGFWRDEISGVGDLDADGDVDLDDFVLFLTVFTGPEVRIIVDTVTVGNPGNTGELSGPGAGGLGLDRVCGAVNYIYDIAKYEVTAGQYTEFLNAVAAEDTYGLYSTNMADPTEWTVGCNIQRAGSSGSYTYSVAADWADRPVNYVSWADVARFANWLHNGQPAGAQDASSTEDGSYDLSMTHYYYGPGGEILDELALNIVLISVVREADATWVIPSEDEWYKAAYHHNDGVTGNYFNYPTSSDSVPVSEPCPGGSNSANYWGQDPAIGPPYYRNHVGCYVVSASPYGTFDQGGNVQEWTEAVTYPLHRGLRGGCWGCPESDLLRASNRGIHDMNPTGEGHNAGFRVAEVRGQGPVSADLDKDGDVDLADFSAFQTLFTGPPSQYIRVLDPGDTWVYSDRRDGTINGEPITVVGTNTINVLDEIVPDYARNPARVTCATFSGILNQETPVTVSVRSYFSQDDDGTWYVHGGADHCTDLSSERFIQIPAEGKVRTLASPITIGATNEWNITYTDGRREVGGNTVVGVERINVPVGEFTAWMIEGGGTVTIGTGTQPYWITSWFVPVLGVNVRLEIDLIYIDDGTNVIGHHVLELVETNVPH